MHVSHFNQVNVLFCREGNTADERCRTSCWTTVESAQPSRWIPDPTKRVRVSESMNQPDALRWLHAGGTRTFWDRQAVVDSRLRQHQRTDGQMSNRRRPIR